MLEATKVRLDAASLRSVCDRQDELAAAALSDFLTLRDEEFERAAQRVLAKHRELYRRLS